MLAYIKTQGWVTTEERNYGNFNISAQWEAGESNVNGVKISDAGVDMRHEKQQMCRCVATCCLLCVDLR